MRLTFGRGKNRQVYDLPHGSEFARAAKSKDPDEVKVYRTAVDNVCTLLKIPGYE